MQIITPEQKGELAFVEIFPRKIKSPLRQAVVDMEIGQIALFKRGEDFVKPRQLYAACSAEKIQNGRLYEMKKLSDGTGAVVTRLN